MQLPTGSRISMSHENNSEVYTLPLLKRMKSIIFHFLGVIFVIAYFIMTNMSQYNGVQEKLILSSILAILIFLDIIMICWIILGKEVISINEEQLTIKNTLFGIGLKRKFSYEKINDLRINIKYQHNQRVKLRIFNFFTLIGFNTGLVIFNHKGKEIMFGSSLSFEEANYLVERIKDRVRKANYYIK